MNPRQRDRPVINTKHPCAVCPAPIGPGLLMCARCWHHVPKDLQEAVFRTYGRITRKAAETHDSLHRIAAYRKARDAATTAAQACTTTPPTTEEASE